LLSKSKLGADGVAALREAEVSVDSTNVPALSLSVDSYLPSRLESLRHTQNPDGGWGYFPGKESWLEPTAYAALALHGEPAADRAWKLLSSWQLPDGSWRPSAAVDVPSWGTSLCVSIAVARQEWGTPLERGVNWLVETSGMESQWLSVLASRIGLVKRDRDVSLKAWPWKPDNAGWVEPTVHALIALKQASARISRSDMRQRIQMGEAQLLDVRSHDGGWNYGSPSALGVDLPSYPETTALALVGLQGRTDLANAFDLVERQMRETPSPLARAWLTVAMRLHGMEPPAPSGGVTTDVMITAVEALAAPQGNHKLLKAGGNV
jgi:hypothetical protein